MDIKKCFVCKRILPKENKSGVCSNCGGKTVYALIKEGFFK